jgi:hypothetical protein
MSEEPTVKQEEQISQWLKKLERESWQLELLVSAFTIFLLIMAMGSYDDFTQKISYTFDLGDSVLSFVYIFLLLLGLSIKALVVFLVLHLMLRGFWIGSIGLRSVQASVDFEKLNYSEFFTDKLKRKVISLDNLVVMLDEICSLIFSFAFLIISIILAFGLYLLFLGIVGFSLGSLAPLTTGAFSTIISIIGAVIAIVVIITGLIYFIDYLTLGFFKKYRWLSRIYYPFYRFYGIITLAVISKSIYYYLISKFSKKRIRIVYTLALLVIIFSSLTEFDQYQFFPNQNDNHVLTTNQYDNLRAADTHISGASIESNIVSKGYLQLFLRYDPSDNELIQSNCPDFSPIKNDGWNWSMKFDSGGGNLLLRAQDYAEVDKNELLDCISSLYKVYINDSIYADLKYYYYTHPSKGQKGLVTMINSSGFTKGENLIEIKKVSVDEDEEKAEKDFTQIPFWFQ